MSNSMDSEPPFQETYETLLQSTLSSSLIGEDKDNGTGAHDPRQQQQLQQQQRQKLVMRRVTEDCDLPIIDMSLLHPGGMRSPGTSKCKKAIVEAAKEWGFFQIVNHGVPREAIESLMHMLIKLFRMPFQSKVGLNFTHSNNSRTYRWGNPHATNLKQLPWSEAFHIPLGDDFSTLNDEDQNFRSIVETYGIMIGNLAELIAEILAEGLGLRGADLNYFKEKCTKDTCFLRMNRYPACPLASSSGSEDVFGLMPHCDTDFLTILHRQEKVGNVGLQILLKDERWVTVNPNPNDDDALLVNVGDLFQAWSNGVYKSVKHRVLASQEEERFSVAFFYCPSDRTIIQAPIKPAIYRSFSFNEYVMQVHNDVQSTGDKVGLPRFLH